MFRLPTYQELSKEQDEINNLPLRGTHLVVGPPGTGKTVLAIYRAEMMKRANLDTQFIVYNNTLEQFLALATNRVEVGSQTRTFHSWFCRWYKRAMNSFPPPQIEPYHYNWSEILSRLTSADERVLSKQLDHLIIDEGQDLPKSAFSVLRLIARNMTVFADENQRITDNNSTIDELRRVLGVEKAYGLGKNYRNSRPIAEFASRFYAGLDTGVAEMPERRGVKPQLMATGGITEREADVVVRYATSRSGQDVGVLLPRTSDQMKLISTIQQKLDRRDSSIPVQMYISDNPDYNEIDFSKAGIKILNYKSAKGLEFDAVFMPKIDEYWGNPRSDGTRMLFYMLTSRAREWLCLMHSSSGIPEVIAHVPAKLYSQVRPG